ncbi:MAG: sce7725 family protein [Oscillospiraceae bacterium]|nr:sce7725 family protein [Oscillospiraceae bacterium]
MYFPYFRGRQYELLALRELVAENLISELVVPIVEPVKLTSTFKGTLEAYTSQNRQIALIFNPEVGAFAGQNNFLEMLSPEQTGLLPGQSEKRSVVIPALLMNSNAECVASTLLHKNVPTEKNIVIITNRDYLESYKNLYTDTSPQYTLFPDEREFRRGITSGKVMLKDNFRKQPKNADYPDDEFYTEDHLFYKDEGYNGFGDYSIVGNEYVEGGFAPYAVAIHIVYFAEDNTLRICHFISDSNDDISDVAGKFNEAVQKLASWYRNGQNKQQTKAIDILLSHSDNGTYPGLPTIKKLSIMHHLELVSKYLDGNLSK